MSALEQLVERLPSPGRPLLGRRAVTLPLPDNIICFHRAAAEDLNRPQRGRALHHRFVLILALRTAVTVCIDDRTIRLEEGEGILVFPFQFHHYIKPENEKLNWLFVTFELVDIEALRPLHFRPFIITPAVRVIATELVSAYLERSEAEMPILLLALLLARLRHEKPAPHRDFGLAPEPPMVLQVNQLMHNSREAPGIKEIARSLGISSSHLRARFRKSCGVSLGRHLRRVRLERACGLLRLSAHRVSEIAEQCGFTSVYTFSRAFHRMYGVSPLAYRHGERRPRRIPL
ncbi:MAG TPA: helix-turn-helix transcriptional regulator [Opitutaceae bacterium]|nr:helix-turn-helix transcriptional regulator [Opitutaceae bacterium]